MEGKKFESYNAPSNEEHLEALEEEVDSLNNKYNFVKEKMQEFKAISKEILEIKTIRDGLLNKQQDLNTYYKEKQGKISENDDEWKSWNDEFQRIINIREKIFELDEEYEKLLNEADRIGTDIEEVLSK